MARKYKKGQRVIIVDLSDPHIDVIPGKVSSFEETPLLDTEGTTETIYHVEPDDNPLEITYIRGEKGLMTPEEWDEANNA